ncbi:MAG TPA: bifunctional diaminohydroxyphosphoribosylaminopyrimidine deaminase/5-amino-6-(5-phosphoribosylamino)uracil reductase RibD [Spirochaetia bacterium]|nr:bifunctional diaminohydroxyphosphoribosylaminopyrimidine deaminase/5-amino-6-(5-phosphoribosylamino)uracil reductase RibD [Spirochaetia bacterium]
MGTDVSVMERALSLARSSRPFAGVNPPVGAVLVRDGVVIGEGFHKGPGTPHAEAAALADARARSTGNGQSFAGATLFCTLEPCCHRGAGKRTPPCTEAIIAAGVSRVVFASQDPNPLVAGKGAARLREAGVRVERGLLADRADSLIEAFSVSIRLHRPFIRLKWAQSLDGRLACRGGASRWITNPGARVLAHALRASHDAVMIGAGTLRTDDPELTVRDAPAEPGLELHQPIRVVCAGRALLPLNARVFSPSLRDRTIVLAAPSSPALAQCRSSAIRVCEVAEDPDGLPDLAESLHILYAEGIGSVLVEGGSQLLTSLLVRSLWDAMTVFTAPLILGQGIEAVGELGIRSPNTGLQLSDTRFQIHDGFIRLDARNPKVTADVPLS